MNASSSSATPCSAWSSPTTSTPPSPTCPKGSWPRCVRPLSMRIRWRRSLPDSKSALSCSWAAARNPLGAREGLDPGRRHGGDHRGGLSGTGTRGARRFILDRFGALIASVPGLGASLDWKTSLQELAAKVGQALRGTSSWAKARPRPHVHRSGARRWADVRSRDPDARKTGRAAGRPDCVRTGAAVAERRCLNYPRSKSFVAAFSTGPPIG